MTACRRKKIIRIGVCILASSVALCLPLILPLRLESSVFVFLVGLAAFSYAFAYLLFRLIKRMPASAAPFGYRPTTTYLAGNKMVKTGKSAVCEDKEGRLAAHAASGKGRSGEDENVHA
ncbi:MAG TPA: hypothetical protein VK448_01010 [Dissulfurispiraceae bacterium]|nr:hypothetical protein [Dissulfurispiraceae bacterium]